MKVLVTGASGRFAPHLVRDLLAHGHEPVLFSRKKPDAEFAGLEWVEGDINNFEDCYKALYKKGFDAVQNLAAKPSPTDTPGSDRYDDFSHFGLTMQTNIMGLYNMLQAALRGDVGVFVHTSSLCAFGLGFRLSGTRIPLKYLPVDEEHPTDGEDSYSFSKLVGEQMLDMYTRAYGMRCYAVRAAGIVNAERRAQMKAGAKPVTAWHDWMFTWVGSEDVASAHRLLMERAGSIVKFGAYYCNADDTNCVEPTLELLKKLRPELIPLLRAPLDGHASLISNNRLKAVVGWKPEKSWR